MISTTTKDDILFTLQAARLLIDDKASWTKGYSARDEAGAPTGPNNDDAHCWCAAGAVDACSPLSNLMLTWRFIRRHEVRPIVNTNDNMGHAAVKRELNRLIRIAVRELECSK